VRTVLGVLALALCGCQLVEDFIPEPTPDARPRPTADAGPLELEAVVAHNQVRAAAVPAPVPPLEPMAWDPTAAEVARDWADACLWRHSGTPGYGENLFASTATGASIGDAVDGWASEIADYDYALNRCAPGKMCGHYTQIVWRSSTLVGCAAAICDTGSPFGSGRWINWVCEYVPPGNYVGERPY
jgi:uncharacterized protein YkwD